MEGSDMRLLRDGGPLGGKLGANTEGDECEDEVFELVCKCRPDELADDVALPAGISILEAFVTDRVERCDC